MAVIAPGDVAAGLEPAREDTWLPLLDDVAKLQGIAAARFAPGSTDPGVVRQRDRGKLTCRERIALLLDEGSFREVGSLAGFASYDEDGRIAAFSPANHVGGSGTIEGRPAVVCADDFTSRGGHADGAIGAKSFHLDQLSMQLQIPSIRLLDGSSGGGSVAAMVPEQKKEGESNAQESTGALSAGKPRVTGGGGSFLPGHLGVEEYARQLGEVPVVNVLLGSVVGIGAAKAVLGHFSVMVRDISQLFVAGPPVVSHAMGYDITKEDLGGWHVHCTNGSVDNLAESEEEAIAATKRFLSYLPSSVFEAPPVVAERGSDRPARGRAALADPAEAHDDVRRPARHRADGRRRLVVRDRRAVGHRPGRRPRPLRRPPGRRRRVRQPPRQRRGDDGRRLRQGDPPPRPVRPVPHPRAEPHRQPRLLRRPRARAQRDDPQGRDVDGGDGPGARCRSSPSSCGAASASPATTRRRPTRQPNVRVSWPAADVGGIPPEGGIEAAYKRQLAEAADPVALRAELNARIESVRGPIGPLNRFQMEELVDPRDTRRLICEWIPTATKVATAPLRLDRRPQGYRP